MKKIFIFISTILVAITISILINFNKGLDKNYISNNYNYEILVKDLNNATDFEFDEDGNTYVAFEDKILKLKKDNSKEVIFASKNEKIGEVAIKENEMFFLLGDKLICKNLSDSKEKIILNNIPNYGDVTKNKIFIEGDYLYLTIDSATNSGVLSKDDLSKNPINKGDISAIDLELKGINFGESKTGAFSPYGTATQKGQLIKANEIGTSSIVKINLNDFNKETISMGIKNVKGIDFNSEGTIYATVGGIDENGARGIYGDVDYVYEINKEKTWYGWPDYSGGDPINSPRFRKEGKVKQEFIINKHPSTPPAPYYQNDNINSLEEMIIDKSGLFLDKDSMMIYDKSKNSIISLNKYGEKKDILSLSKGTIDDMKIYKDNFYFLDGDLGYLVKINNTDNNLSKSKLFILIGIGVSMIIITLFIIIKKNK